MVRVIGIAAFMLASSSFIVAAEERTPFFNGGMFYHGGYGSIAYGSGINGYANGLGGRLALALLPNLRIGGMGFASSFSYTSAGVSDSYYSVGFGGMTAEAHLSFHPIRFSLGALVGGGAIRQLHVETVNGDSSRTVRLEHYASFILMPYLITEFVISDVISIALMADWVLGSRFAGGYSYGQRIHIGLLFNR
ncbi:MAG: hypothetical protein AABZ39_16495 [Spirochaetota bacterium]